MLTFVTANLKLIVYACINIMPPPLFLWINWSTSTRIIPCALAWFQLVDTTVEIANKVGAAEIVSRVVDDLKDEAEQYRKMVMESIEKIMGNLGSADIDSRLEEQLIDGILYAFQEQTNEVGAASRNSI